MLALGTGLVLLACGSDNGEPATPAREYCNHLCAAAIGCGANTTLATCIPRCERENSGLNDLSLAGTRAIGACVSRLSCSALFDSEHWDATWKTCWDEGQATLHPSLEVQTFCSHYAQTLFECNEWLSVSDCEQNFSMWQPHIVQEVDACAMNMSCSELDSCVQAVFSP